MQTTDAPEPAEQTTETPAESSPASQIRPGRIKAYHRAQRNCHLTGIFISVAYWVVCSLLAGGLVAWVDGFVDARWLGLFVAAAVMLGVNVVVSLPLSYYSGFVLEHRFDLSNQTAGAWFVFQLKGWLVGGILGLILLSGLFAALWYAGTFWGVWLWIGVMLLSIGLAKLFPLLILPLFYPATPLDRPSLIDRLTELASGSGLKVTGVFNLGMSKETKKANAMLTGLGSSRRVYLSDTLLDGFNDNQITVVFAHELGHHVKGHILKGIGLAAVVSSILVSLIWLRLNEHAGGDAAAWTEPVALLAQVMLILSIFPLFTGPVTNAISRHFERQADRIALELTDDPEAYRSAFENLSTMNLADPDPPRWEEIMFDDHPALSKRIAMADEYVRSRGG